MSNKHLGDGRKKRRKQSTGSKNMRGHNQVKSRSQISAHSSTHSVRSLDDRPKSKNRKKAKQSPQHSRYATQPNAPKPTKTKTNKTTNKKKRNRPKNKIKSRNKAHRKAATTHNALNPNSKNTANYSSHRPSATTPNALSVNGSTASRRSRSSSNPRQFRHKFNMTEMQLVIGQISDMKKSWKTPAEEVMGRIYEIIDMEERPHLNGKHCKVMLILDDENYRVRLLGNSSEHIVERYNLKIAFETENLYLLWESQTNANSGSKKKKKSTFNSSSHQPPPPQSPPNQDPDEIYTIQAFETSFENTYEFRRYDFYCMACCIVLGVLMSGFGAFLYFSNGKDKDLYAIGAFCVVFAPMIGLLVGIYIGCLWYCCAVSRGKMDYYLGKNRFFGLRCKGCDFCKYQYFIVVALIGLFVMIVSISSYLLFDSFIVMEDDNGVNGENGNEGNVTLPMERDTLFFGVEMLTGIGGIGLFIFGIIIYYCCSTRKVETRQGPSIHDDDEYQQ